MSSKAPTTAATARWTFSVITVMMVAAKMTMAMICMVFIKGHDPFQSAPDSTQAKGTWRWNMAWELFPLY